MSEIFLKIFNMSLAAGWMILAVVLLRLVLRRAPKWINPLLWCAVGIRLIWPFTIKSALSLIPSAEVLSTEAVHSDIEPVINSGLQFVDEAVNSAFGAAFAPAPGAGASPLYMLTEIASVVWVIGIAAMLASALASWLVLRGRVSGAVRVEGDVYRGKFVTEPFVLGALRPRIYLPQGLAPEEEKHVLAHERAHIARRDTWIKPLGWVILSLHWFNPLVWLAYALFCRDIEFACDERVVKDLTPEGRADYSATLLKCGTAARRVSACPLAFGESGVKSRVKSVLNYKKPAFWLIAVAIAAAIALTVFFLTDPADVNEPGNADEVPGEPATVSSETPAPTAQPEQVTPNAEQETPNAQEYLPAVKALISDLALVRLGDNDEQQVRETVRIYLMLKSELEYHPGWKEPNFEIFFDTSSDNYASLAADLDYSRGVAEMMAGSGYEVIWDNVTVDFNSVEIDGDRASVDCYCTVQYISSTVGDMLSGVGCQYWIELREVDGIWLLTDLSTPPRNY